ncbi:FG-GAP repeat domain-containing protein [Algoriphagus boseongensis]|uniref:FG-GAP repeat domain-containing protein n=1 Tax=Algoriphagus boseongensis TaxID=1442587 RepID=UPI001414F20A|nr:VCBS repeat-containing protein [Algoriphagus boseongensis]
MALLFSCSGEKIENQENNTDSFLWIDETEKYLPQTAEWTNRVEAADLNGDQLIDLIFANGGDYSEPGTLESSRVFLNQGPNQAFKEVTNEIFGESKFYARVIKVRDLNQDGFPDIVVGNTFQNQSEIYLGEGNGKFKRATETHFPKILASVGDLEFGDVDDDGDLDIILANWGPGSNMENNGGRTLLWLNDGNAVFTDVTSSQMPEKLIQFSWDLEFLDFDNDFDLDIVVSCKMCGTSRLFMNDGKGNFKDVRRFPAYTNNYEFEPMDVNGDGFLDLVTVNDGEIVGGNSWSRREHLFLNDSAKRFIDVSSANWPDQENIGEDDNNVVFLDFDSDGDPDFLLSSLTGEDRLLINDGKGNFSLRQSILSGDPTPHTLSLVLADLDNDQRMDIIMGQGEGEEIIEERIFMGKNIPRDTAKPIISHYKVDKVGSDEIAIKARIHDNKSPSMPQDWQSVYVLIGENQWPMSWYGEYLWKVRIPQKDISKEISLCSIDAAGNQTCISIQVE